MLAFFGYYLYTLVFLVDAFDMIFLAGSVV